MNVLILGNGLSRLSFDKEIREYTGEVWGCNRIYLDYGAILDGIVGHTDVIEEARHAREKNGYKYKILGTDESPYQCAERFRKDSGTTLVSEALTRGYDRIDLCGFDLGGYDCYSPGHEKKNKTTWIQRWRMILQEFGSNKIHFWGYDHLPFLLSDEKPSVYWKKYSQGKSHAGDEYERQSAQWRNDYSRIFSIIPHVWLENIGGREWKFIEYENKIGEGGKIKMPEFLAQKYRDAYPKDFRILPLNEND